jgi:hypothetical protein
MRTKTPNPKILKCMYPAYGAITIPKEAKRINLHLGTDGIYYKPNGEKLSGNLLELLKMGYERI